MEAMETQKAPDNPGVIAIPPLLYIGMLLVALIAQHFYPITYVPEFLHIKAGVLLISISLPIAGSAVWQMRRAHTAIDVRKPTNAIVTQGMFRFSRNPMYLSLTLLYLGLSTLMNSAWGLIGIVPLLVLMQRGVIAREERYLEKKFGAQYLWYKKRVRRWI